MDAFHHHFQSEILKKKEIEISQNQLFMMDFLIENYVETAYTTGKNDCSAPRIVYNSRGVPQDHLSISGS